MTDSESRCELADYASAADCRAILQLMDVYARDPMGGGRALPDAVRQRLCQDLAAFPGACSVLAWQGDQAVGLINAFPGYSTFAARPLLNIHDVVVAPQYRGQQIFDGMLARLERVARERGCCKLTLEVLANNHRARGAYERTGFTDYQLDPCHGQADFVQKVPVIQKTYFMQKNLGASRAVETPRS